MLLNGERESTLSRTFSANIIFSIQPDQGKVQPNIAVIRILVSK
tara:strand:+ start:417 stop:548 length:132 start_codon:yes stop_codon:yes gene_type:complete